MRRLYYCKCCARGAYMQNAKTRRPKRRIPRVLLPMTNRVYNSRREVMCQAAPGTAYGLLHSQLFFDRQRWELERTTFPNAQRTVVVAKRIRRQLGGRSSRGASIQGCLVGFDIKLGVRFLVFLVAAPIQEVGRERERASVSAVMWEVAYCAYLSSNSVRCTILPSSSFTQMACTASCSCIGCDPSSS